MSEKTRRGDIAEYAVITKLLQYGYTVLQPITNASPYDLAVDLAGKLVRIQVKTAYLYNKKSWAAHVTGSKSGKYTKKDVDFLVFVVAERDTFYVIPVEVIESIGDKIYLNPDRPEQDKYGKYRENWWLNELH